MWKLKKKFFVTTSLFMTLIRPYNYIYNLPVATIIIYMCCKTTRTDIESKSWILICGKCTLKKEFLKTYLNEYDKKITILTLVIAVGTLENFIDVKVTLTSVEKSNPLLIGRYGEWQRFEALLKCFLKSPGDLPIDLVFELLLGLVWIISGVASTFQSLW